MYCSAEDECDSVESSPFFISLVGRVGIKKLVLMQPLDELVTFNPLCEIDIYKVGCTLLWYHMNGWTADEVMRIHMKAHVPVNVLESLGI